MHALCVANPTMRLFALLSMACLLLAIAAPAAAQAPSGAKTTAPPQTLGVAAAASLSDVMPEVARGFEAAHPGSAVRVNAAASGVLLEQIAAGAQLDVYTSADADTLLRGIERRLLRPDTRRDFASNEMVLIVPAASTRLPLEQLADLARPEVRRIAIGKTATVPAGRYAREIIDSVRLWPALQRKIVAADDVRQVLDLVARGEVDAGFVYRTDAATVPDRVRVVRVFSDHTPVRYSAAVVAGSRNETLARAFVLWLGGAEARAVLQRHGFGPP